MNLQINWEVRYERSFSVENVRIIEKFTKSKSTDANANEDGYLITENYIAVIDGATSKTEMMTSGKTGGRILKDIIMDAIKELKGGEESSSAICAIQKVILEKASEERIGHASASAIIYSIKKQEIWSIGDCQAYVGKKHYINAKEIDIILSQARTVAVRAYLEEGTTVQELLEHDKCRELILPFLKLQVAFENKKVPLGYCVFNNITNGEVFPYEMATVIPVTEPAEIVLASDGYPLLKTTLAESEEMLQRVLKEDPLCYQIVPSTKGIQKGNCSFDDRTYIRFQIN